MVGQLDRRVIPVGYIRFPDKPGSLKDKVGGTNLHDQNAFEQNLGWINSVSIPKKIISFRRIFLRSSPDFQNRCKKLKYFGRILKKKESSFLRFLLRTFSIRIFRRPKSPPVQKKAQGGVY